MNMQNDMFHVGYIHYWLEYLQIQKLRSGSYTIHQLNKNVSFNSKDHCVCYSFCLLFGNKICYIISVCTFKFVNEYLDRKADPPNVMILDTLL